MFKPKFKVGQLIRNDFGNWKGSQLWQILSLNLDKKYYEVKYIYENREETRLDLGIIHFSDEHRFCLATFNIAKFWNKICLKTAKS